MSSPDRHLPSHLQAPRLESSSCSIDPMSRRCPFWFLQPLRGHRVPPSCCRDRRQGLSHICLRDHECDLRLSYFTASSLLLSTRVLRQVSCRMSRVSHALLSSRFEQGALLHNVSTDRPFHLAAGFVMFLRLDSSTLRLPFLVCFLLSALCSRNCACAYANAASCVVETLVRRHVSSSRIFSCFFFCVLLLHLCAYSFSPHGLCLHAGSAEPRSRGVLPSFYYHSSLVSPLPLRPSDIVYIR